MGTLQALEQLGDTLLIRHASATGRSRKASPWGAAGFGSPGRREGGVEKMWGGRSLVATGKIRTGQVLSPSDKQHLTLELMDGTASDFHWFLCCTGLEADDCWVELQNPLMAS